MLNFGKMAHVVILSVMLFSKASLAHDGPSSEPPDRETKARVQYFTFVWDRRNQKGNQKNVVAQLQRFLNDPFPPLRLKAVRALGQLESPVARPQLQYLLQIMKMGDNQSQPNGIPVQTLELALGHIDARNLRGKAKVETVLKSVGLTWPAFVQMTQQLNGNPKAPSSFNVGEDVLKDMVDLLYRMGKHGETVWPLATQLSLTPSQRIQIQGSALTLNQEIQLILNYLTNLFIVTADIDNILRHLVDLGPAANTAIMGRLQEIKRNPLKYAGMIPSRNTPGAYEERKGYIGILRAAARTKDRRMIPLLKALEQIGNTQIAEKARMTRTFIERD